MITGLRYGQISKFDITSLRIRDKYFNGENKICNDQLEEIFLSLCNKGWKMSIKRTKKKGKLTKEVNLDEEILKFALLYFLEHVLLGKEGNNLIYLHWVQLVDSLEDLTSIHGREFVLIEHCLG